ncbi:hypothetical protein SLEP1_g60398, partial [Rubroshorea leprosula]
MNPARGFVVNPARGFVVNPTCEFAMNLGSWVRDEPTSWIHRDKPNLSNGSEHSSFADRFMVLLAITFFRTPRNIGIAYLQAPGFFSFLLPLGEPRSWVRPKPKYLGSLQTRELGSSRTQALGFAWRPRARFLVNPGSWVPREPRLLGSLG